MHHSIGFIEYIGKLSLQRASYGFHFDATGSCFHSLQFGSLPFATWALPKTPLAIPLNSVLIAYRLMAFD